MPGNDIIKACDEIAYRARHGLDPIGYQPPIGSEAGENCAPLTGSAPPCPGGCRHTEAEHVAFDSGVIAGEKGQADSANPYEDFNLGEAWLTGHSIGEQNRRAETEAQNVAVRHGTE